jgi:hypothetical protein
LATFPPSPLPAAPYLSPPALPSPLTPVSARSITPRDDLDDYAFPQECSAQCAAVVQFRDNCRSKNMDIDDDNDNDNDDDDDRNRNNSTTTANNNNGTMSECHECYVSRRLRLILPRLR